MNETVFNIFYIVSCDQRSIVELGAVAHSLSGSDEDKIRFLQNNVQHDSLSCSRYAVPKSLCDKDGKLSMAQFNSMIRLGRSMELFEDIFKLYKAPASVLYISTPIVDGTPTYDIQSGHGVLYLTDHQGHPKLGAGKMSDYLEQYFVDGQLDIASLIHNDHYIAIKLLFNKQHYLSSMKLLVSFVDTMGYLDFGENGNVFILWLRKYAVLADLGITEEELWEFRNSILHMTNLDSRKVKQGKVERISFTISPSGTETFSDHDTKYFNFVDLISVLKKAMEKWLISYVESPQKLVDFVMRYDRVVADSRYAELP
ncbi:hypothetical protein [Vibrio parahaemolyticus]|uniref:hypothetical protein n=1 Tax=Vibrio parahaemolyticus TaxID=670 RepID=UPI00044F0D22|nr:hypothetical protein [Vibrio parahaemolyticus]EXJ30063.1 hypothetical protein D048_1402 [Vibrio parahaemolyticus VPTS-2009]